MYLVVMSDQIFLLSDQNGALVGHMSFQGKFICSPALWNVLHVSLRMITCISTYLLKLALNIS